MINTRNPMFECPKHGEQEMGLQLNYKNQPKTLMYCLKCLDEFLFKNVLVLMEKPVEKDNEPA